jgi:hypothetical protein
MLGRKADFTRREYLPFSRFHNSKQEVDFLHRFPTVVQKDLWLLRKTVTNIYDIWEFNCDDCKYYRLKECDVVWSGFTSFLSSRQEQHIPSKCRQISTRLYVTCQNTVISKTNINTLSKNKQIYLTEGATMRFLQPVTQCKINQRIHNQGIREKWNIFSVTEK